MAEPFDGILKTASMICEVCDLTTKYESDLGARAQIDCFRRAFEKAASYYEEMGNYTRADAFGEVAAVLHRVLEPTSRDPEPTMQEANQRVGKWPADIFGPSPTKREE